MDALDAPERRLLKQQAALVALSRSDVVQSGDLERALRQIARTAAEVLEVERVGVWKLERSPVELTCLTSYEVRSGRYTSGMKVGESACPAYFRAISTSDIVAADRAREDPRTRELDEVYLTPYGVGSLMDVPIYGLDGRWGVLCHEHVGPPREWKRDEQIFAMGLANLVSAAVDSVERHEAERSLRAYLENACDCMVTMDLEGRVLYANQAWFDVMRYGPEDVARGLRVQSLASEEAAPRAAALFERLSRGEPLRFEGLALRAKDGRRVLADGSAWARIQDGKPRTLYAHWRDATAEHEREAHHRLFLNQSAGMYHYAIREPMPLALPVEEQIDWILRHNYLVECNAAHARFFGYESPEQMMGLRLQDSYAGVEEARDLIRRWIEAGYRAEGTESRERTPSGEERWFLGFSTGQVEAGRLTRAFGLRLDITARKLAEKALRESEGKFRQFAENMRDVFWMSDLKEGRFAYVSPAFETVFGLPVETLYENASAWLQAVHPGDRDWVRQAFSERGARESFDLVYRIQRPDGSTGWLHDRGSRILDEAGRPDRLVGVAEDVTEIKSSEAALRESERRLTEALRASEDRVIQLEGQARDPQSLERMVGKSAAMKDVYRRVRLAAQSDVTVLVTGESGTGKELVASAIHSLSARRDKPYVAVNCTAIPEPLLESEIFGHVKGAFTGATRDRQGLLRAAEGGTLFLDEVGDMSPSLQAKLLRVLQERCYRPVGGEAELRCDVRVVAATNRDLEAAVESGAVREDFYYRVRVFPLALPALRDRKEDVPLLVAHFVAELSGRTGRKIGGVAAEAMRALVGHAWPGNVRELRNALEHAFVSAQGDHLRESDLPPEILRATAPEPSSLTGEGQMERRRLEDALRRARGNRTEAAKLMGISRVTFWKRMQKYGVEDR